MYYYDDGPDGDDDYYYPHLLGLQVPPQKVLKDPPNFKPKQTPSY